MKLFLFYTSMFFVALYFGYLTWKELQPFETSKITAVVPVDKSSYHPGEAIGFKLDLCVDGFKWDEVTYQLESEENNGSFYYKVLGSYKSIGRPGCFKITDLNSVIPKDFFEQSSIIREGKHRLFVIITRPQNEQKAPTIYQSDWFLIEKDIK